MKKYSFKALALALPLLGSALGGTAVFAAGEDYGIEYTGGEPLGTSNVTIDPALVNSLTTLMSQRDVTTSISISNRWEKGYLKDGQVCRKLDYIRVTNSNPIVESDGIYFNIKKGKYSAKVDIKSVNLANYNDDSKFATIGVVEGMTYVWAGWHVFSDSECTVDADGMENQVISMKNDNRLFAKMNVKLYKDNKAFVHDGLYFGITDIDASQSYKILSADNELSKNNMIAKSAEDLQTTDPVNMPYRNMFVEDGGYIYSEYNGYAVSPVTMNLGTSNADIYLPLTTTTQTNGLDFIFGFGAGAASGIEYYAQQFNIVYGSDDNGTITGITEEKVMKTDTPSGSKSKPNEGYELSYWTANKDVTLTDGTTIKAGKPITAEQIKQVVVTEDIIFTAVHDKVVLAPDTGFITKEDNGATAISVSIIGLAVVAIISFYLPRINHKKVNFDRK